jgi:hypothetical protein
MSVTVSGGNQKPRHGAVVETATAGQGLLDVVGVEARDDAASRRSGALLRCTRKESEADPSDRTLHLASGDEGVLNIVIHAPPINLIGPELVRER